MKRPPVAVIGMHRSGTSCLAGCLEDLGLNLGDVITEALTRTRPTRVARSNTADRGRKGGCVRWHGAACGCWQVAS